MNGNNWLENLLKVGARRSASQPLGERGRGMIEGITPTRLTQGQQGQQGQSEQGGGNWLQTLLKIALPALGGIYAGSQAGFEAPHGGTIGWKGTMGKGLQSYGKALTQIEEARVAKEQEEREAEAERQQQEIENMMKLEQLGIARGKLEQDIREYEEPLPKQPTPKLPEEIEAIEALIKQREASAAASWALVAKRKQEMVGTDSEDMYDVPTTWSKFDSIVGEAAWEQLYSEYDMAIKNKNREAFDALWDEIELRQNKMRKMTVRTDEVGNKSMSESETKDYSNLTNMRNWMSKNLEKIDMVAPVTAGKSPREIQLDRMKQHHDRGEKYKKEGNDRLANEWFTRAIAIGNKLGLNETEFADILGVTIE